MVEAIFTEVGDGREYLGCLVPSMLVPVLVAINGFLRLAHVHCWLGNLQSLLGARLQKLLVTGVLWIGWHLSSYHLTAGLAVTQLCRACLLLAWSGKVLLLPWRTSSWYFGACVFVHVVDELGFRCLEVPVTP